MTRAKSDSTGTEFAQEAATLQPSSGFLYECEGKRVR
jgi:hypothetical protein